VQCSILHGCHAAAKLFRCVGTFFAEALKLFYNRNVAARLALASIFLADLANFGPRPRVARFFCAKPTIVAADQWPNRLNCMAPRHRIVNAPPL
jgi:hypothetical protein